MVVLGISVALIGSGCASGLPAASLDPAGVAATITSASLGTTLDAIAAIATAHAGTRRTGSAGEAATGEYIASALTALGYRPSTDDFGTLVYTDGTADALAILGSGGRSFEAGRDFGPLMFSTFGSVTGRVVDLGWDSGASGGYAPGCLGSDFAGVPAGAIVLTRPGPCATRTVVDNAHEAGASAVIFANPAAGPGEVRRSTLVDAVWIPALAADRAVGEALAAAARSGQQVRLVASGTSSWGTVRSVIAELPGADPSRVVILGAHLDSSMDGPGVNDDGSGVAAVLAVARALAGTRPAVAVRFAFWAAEESGDKGSAHYVTQRVARSTERVIAYLNADMLGSPNGVRDVYDDAGAAPGSDEIRDLFTTDLSAAGLAWQTVDLSGRADHASFEAAGIPTGGLFSGANETLSAAQAKQFGRTAGRAADACYHLACDGRANVDATLLLELTRSLAGVTAGLANG